jgi:Trypsin
MKLSSKLWPLFLVAFGPSLAGCADEGATPAASSAGDDIVGGVPGFTFPEAVLIDYKAADGRGFLCSGSVVSPRVVLTAGHCVVEGVSWRVTAPNAGGQTASSTRGLTDFVSIGSKVNPDSLDVGLLVLDSPIALSSYPTVASSPSAPGTEVRVVGRQFNGDPSSRQIAQSPRSMTLQNGADFGLPFSYVSTIDLTSIGITEGGDSGGPDFLDGTHHIVAVNQGGGTGTDDETGEVLNIAISSRVDLFFDRIQQTIAENP